MATVSANVSIEYYPEMFSTCNSEFMMLPEVFVVVITDLVIINVRKTSIGISAIISMPQHHQTISGESPQPQVG
jgi:hypothetical protein